MKKILITLSLLLNTPALFAAQEPVSLKEAYLLARERSEDLAIGQERVSIAQANTYQALDTVMPKIHYVISEQRQDAGDSSGSSDSSDFGSNFTRRRTPQQRFTFIQPIFSGFKEVAVVQSLGVEKSQRRHEIRRMEELLFMEVVDAYYSLARARADLEILNGIHELLGKRMDDLKSRAELGRSRDSEVQSSIAEIKVLEAELEAAKGTERVASQLLEYYIGRDTDFSLADEDGLKAEVESVAEALGKAAKRSDVLAAKDAKFLAEKSVTVARSGLFPNANLQGNYYTERVGTQSEIDWDILLTIDIPIFEGTRVIGDIKEAAANSQIAELEFRRAKRLAELEINNAFETFKASGLEERALGAAVEASQKNYDMHAKEYSYQLVNNLDVLDSLRQYQDIRRRFNLSHYESLKNFWRLKVAIGEVFE